MNYETITNQNQAKLEGVRVEFITENGKTLKAVQIFDAKGESIIIGYGGSYPEAVKVTRPQAFTVEKRHVVSADLPGGIQIREVFETDEAAEFRLDEIRKGQGLLTYDDKVAKRAEVEVKIDAAGKVIGRYVPAGIEPPADEIPF